MTTSREPMPGAEKSPYGVCPGCQLWGLVLDPDDPTRLDCSAIHCHFACLLDEAPRIRVGMQLQRERQGEGEPFLPPAGRVHRYLVIYSLGASSTSHSTCFSTPEGVAAHLEELKLRLASDAWRPVWSYPFLVWDLDENVKVREGALFHD